jgi:uncharacterized protein YdhG (YjbR/CyaY superfamily)
VDEYLASLSTDTRTALRKLRKAIRAAAPSAEECISYQLPAFRLDGHMLVGFGAAENHCALYLLSSTVVAAHKDELRLYDTSTGAIRFKADKPLPSALVRKLVKARIAENRARHGEPK